MSVTPDISIVVCTYNRAEMLEEALNSLAKLDTGNRFTYEVLVVDNASTDHTRSVIHNANDRHPFAIRYVKESRRGITSARNRGVAESQSRWIAFFDDDQLADSKWLSELLRMAEKYDVRCVGGAVHLYFSETHKRQLAPICRMLLGESVGMEEPIQYNHKITPGTGNLLVHRSIFEEVGQFREMPEQRGEDTDLFRRIHAAGIHAWYTPRAIVHHVIPACRLRIEYLASLARIVGGGVARREFNRCGFLHFSILWFARILQAIIRTIPPLLWAKTFNDQEKILGIRCQLALSLEYLRCGLKETARLLRSQSAKRLANWRSSEKVNLPTK